MEAAEPPIYSIGAVERMVGVSATTLRNWEERYGLIRPERSAGGHRLYTRSQVEQIGFLAARLEDGVQAADAHRLLAERLAAGATVAAGEDGDDPTLLVLVAERDRYAAEFSEFFLRTEGYQVVLALDAEAAELAIAEHAPQLIVVEWLLSGNAGPALCRQAKERSAVACLAVSSLDVRDEALAAGADAFLQKPLEPLRFVSTIKDLLGRSAFLAAPAGFAR
jgi:DNA-binding transcriptional MerR regulator